MYKIQNKIFLKITNHNNKILYKIKTNHKIIIKKSKTNNKIHKKILHNKISNLTQINLVFNLLSVQVYQTVVQPMIADSKKFLDP